MGTDYNLVLHSVPSFPWLEGKVGLYGWAGCSLHKGTQLYTILCFTRPPLAQAVSILGVPVLHSQRIWKREWRPRVRCVSSAGRAVLVPEEATRSAVTCAAWKLPSHGTKASVPSDLGFPPPSSNAVKSLGPSASFGIHITGPPWPGCVPPTWREGRRQGGATQGPSPNQCAGGPGPGCGQHREFLHPDGPWSLGPRPSHHGLRLPVLSPRDQK